MPQKVQKRDVRSMMVVKKKPAGADFGLPKKGKARLAIKTKYKKTSSAYAKVPYVRHGNLTIKARPEQKPVKISLKTLWACDDKEIIDLLKTDGFLPELQGTTCSLCGEGALGPLKNVHTYGWRHRCNRKGCQAYSSAHSNHPIFMSTSGSASTSLQDQAAVLLCAVEDVQLAKCHALTGANHKMVERIYHSLEEAQLQYVERKEKTIVFGDGKTWVDVEADEVDLRKYINPDPMTDPNQKVEWEQWCGVVQRGSPDTLVLHRLSPKKTPERAPGPGPIRKEEWRAIAKARLQGRSVILHTDGAQSYKLKLPGVMHDFVVHKKKKVVVDGVTTWIKPKFVKTFTHTLPGGKHLKVKGGTQVIDRFWSHLRSRLAHRSAKPGSWALRRRIRSAQWSYWNKDQNLWERTGQMLHSLR